MSVTPPALETWETLLILRLRQMRRSGVRAALVHLDDNPAVREIGRRENLAGDKLSLLYFDDAALTMTTEGI
jgi:hypothetical protein